MKLLGYLKGHKGAGSRESQRSEIEALTGTGVWDETLKRTSSRY